MTKPKHWYAEEELQHKNYSTWPLLVHQETKVHAWAVPTYQMVSETYCTRHLHCAYLNTMFIILWRCLSYAFASGFNILFHLDSMSSSIFSHDLEFAYNVVPTRGCLNSFKSIIFCTCSCVMYKALTHFLSMCIKWYNLRLTIESTYRGDGFPRKKSLLKIKFVVVVIFCRTYF